MKTEIIVPILGAGAALVWFGLTQSEPEIKRAKTLGAPPADPNLIPTHTQSANEKQNVTYAQLLTAYKEELQKWETVRDAAANRMDSIEAEASRVCRDFAWNATWNYKYNWLGTYGWTVMSKEQPKSLLSSCADYVTGKASSPGTPRIKAPPTAGAMWMDHDWEDVARQIKLLQEKVANAKKLIADLRASYAKAKAERDTAASKAEEMKRKIADLHAQEVY
ncbi:PspA/IM30 family protein [Oceanithermus sp.]